jgi:hypothetical protein
MKLVVVSILFSVVSAIQPARSDSLWVHNGSVLSLEASGDKRRFHYRTPLSGLPVGPGTLLFTGRRNGNRYFGTAYVFSSTCPAMPYSVSGTVSEDDRRVAMYGKAPRLDERCMVIGYVSDVLLFEFYETSQERITAQAASTLICIHPVFAEEQRLRGSIDGTEERTNEIAEAINYLHAKYCRVIEEELSYDSKEYTADNCFQYTGIFRGERVYWGQCHE